MLYMVIEHIQARDALAIYRRVRDQGRQLPDGLEYVDSWVELDLGRVFQLMTCDDPTLLQRWVTQWADLGEFEIVPVTHSADTRRALDPLL